MAIYPNGMWRPLPENETQDHIMPRVVILHTAVATAESLFGYYSSPGVNLESQFYLPEHNPMEQYVETTRQADANLDANSFAISIEAWDNGHPENTPYTPSQMDRLVDCIVWCCITHNIPAVRCPAWNGSGIGYHTMWGAPSHWTPVSKTCPGGPKIAQFPEVLSRVQQALAGMSQPSPKENDMTYLIVRGNADPATFLVSGDFRIYLNSQLAVNEFVRSIEAIDPKLIKYDGRDSVGNVKPFWWEQWMIDSFGAARPGVDDNPYLIAEG